MFFFMIWDMISGMIFLWFWEALLFHLRFFFVICGMIFFDFGYDFFMKIL